MKKAIKKSSRDRHRTKKEQEYQELKEELIMLAQDKRDSMDEFLKELAEDFYDMEELQEIYNDWLE
jgi:hypothetical protein